MARAIIPSANLPTIFSSGIGAPWRKLKGEKVSRLNGNNDETFNAFDVKSWTATTAELDTVLTNLEQFVTQADVQALVKVAPEISNIATHNAYHTGQMVFVRKEQGFWNPENGVK